jgi:D-3-phosphoglycerate dehydrogenase
LAPARALTPSTHDPVNLTFYTAEAMRRLEEETLERSFEILEGRPVPIKSKDPRLQGQEYGVTYG